MFIWTIRWPLIVEAINSILVQAIGGTTVFIGHAISFAVVFWGGWLVGRERWGTLAHAAWVGPVVWLLGFTIVAGLVGSLTGDFSEVEETLAGTWAESQPHLAYFAGVVIAATLFTPFAVLISLFGGVVGKKMRGGKQTLREGDTPSNTSLNKDAR